MRNSVNLCTSSRCCMIEMRDFIKDSLCECVGQYTLDEVIIACNEIIGNCHLHGGGENVTFAFEREEQGTEIKIVAIASSFLQNEESLKVKIEDAKKNVKNQHLPNFTLESGRGFHILAAITRDLSLNGSSLNMRIPISSN